MVEKEEGEKQEEAPKEEKPSKGKGKPIINVLAIVIGIGALGFVATRLIGITGKKVAERAVEEAIEEATQGEAKVDISEEGGEVTIETEEGTFTAGQKELPDNFPSDMPVYPDANIGTTASSEDTVSVSLSTDDSLATVSNYYKDELAAEGWEITQTATLENATVYDIKKGKITGAVAVAETDEGVSIIITLELTSE